MQALKSVDLWTPPTLEDWLSTAEQEPRWIIPGFVPHESLVLVSGQQKRAFKTWLADLMALLISNGQPCGLLTPKEKLPVLYIEEEGSRAGTANRILGLCQALNLGPGSRKNIRYAFHQRVKLDNETWRHRLQRVVRDLGIKVVVLDAMSYLHSGDENKTSEMLAVIDTLQNLRSLGCTVFFLAHLDKARGEDPNADIDSQVRGSSIVVNCYDTHLALRRYKRSDKSIALTVRHREAEERHYQVTWTIRKGLGDKVDYALPTVEADGEDEKERDLAAQRLAQLVPGEKYSLRDLKGLWRNSTADAQEMAKLAVQEGFLVKDGVNFTAQFPK